MRFFCLLKSRFGPLVAIWLLSRCLALGGDFTFDLNQGIPAGSELGEASQWAPAGGINNSGVVKLTRAVNDQQGYFALPVLESSRVVTAFSLQLKVFIGGGSSPPADGFYISFARSRDVNDGLFLEFDSYDNGGGEAPAIDVFWKGVRVGRVLTGVSQGPGGHQFYDVSVKMDADGTLDLSYNGNPIYTNLVTGFQPQADAKFIFTAQTGALSDNHWIDDIHIETALASLTPFQAWYDSFLPGQGGAADPDGDYNKNGISNFAEFAFNLNLLSGGAPALLEIKSENSLVYSRRFNSGLVYEVEMSYSGLGAFTWWNGVKGVDYEEESVVKGDVETITVHVLKPRLLKPKFFRVRASLPG